MEYITKLKEYYSSKKFLENFIYDGNDLGVEWDENGTTFLVWSPESDSIYLNLY